MSNPVTIRIRDDAFDLARRSAGLESNASLAQAMGVHPTTVARTLKGEAQLGVPFITGLLRAFASRLTFEDLFELSPEAEPADREAIPA